MSLQSVKPSLKIYLNPARVGHKKGILIATHKTRLKPGREMQIRGKQKGFSVLPGERTRIDKLLYRVINSTGKVLGTQEEQQQAKWIIACSGSLNFNDDIINRIRSFPFLSRFDLLKVKEQLFI